jgi:hypothetical protein
MSAMAGAATASAQPVKKHGSSSKDKNAGVPAATTTLCLALPDLAFCERKKIDLAVLGIFYN